MRHSTALRSMIAACLIIVGCKPAQDNPSEIEGVWKVTKIIDLTETTESDPGNIHYMISSEHIMTVGGKDERPVVENNFALMSHEEILSQLPAGGGFMEYEIIDGKIHRTTRYALSEYFEGKLIITEFEVDADRLVFRDNHHADGHLREWHMIRVE